MKLRGLSQSKIAGIAGMSRQAVSLWFKSANDFQDIKVSHLLKLGKGLGIPISELTQQLPVTSFVLLYKEFCWDNLYADFPDFIIAVLRNEYKALGRMVQCRGIYFTASLVGEKVWILFPEYKKFILHVKRKEVEHLWYVHQNLIPQLQKKHFRNHYIKR